MAGGENFVKDLRYKDFKDDTSLKKRDIRHINDFAEQEFKKLKGVEDWKNQFEKAIFEELEKMKVSEQNNIIKTITEDLTFLQQEVKNEKWTSIEDSTENWGNTENNAKTSNITTSETQETWNDTENDSRQVKDYKFDNLSSDEEQNTDDLEWSERKISRQVRKDVSAFLHSIDKVRWSEKINLRKFANLALSLERNSNSEKDPNNTMENKLVQMFAKGTTNSTDYGEVLWVSKISQTNLNRIQDLQKVFNESQNPYKNAHPIFGRMVMLIQDKGSFENVLASFDDSIENYNQSKKETKKTNSKTIEQYQAELAALDKTADGYEAKQEAILNKMNTKLGNNNREEKLLNLGIDTKLFSKVSQVSDAWEKKSFEDKISDFNRDGFVNYWDTANKTWIQMKNIIAKYWETSVKSNLEKYATSMANNIWIEKFNDLSEAEKILLMQEVVKNPPQELNYMFSDRLDDTTTAEQLYMQDHNETQAQANEAAKNMIQGLELPDTVTQEWLQQVVSTALISSYQKWLAAWLSMPLFRDYVKWISLNVWVAGWKLLEWKPQDFLSVSLSYNKNIDLKNWWAVWLWASVGSTLAVIPVASIWWELSKEIWNWKSAWEQKYKRISVWANATFIPGLVVWWLKAWIDSNRKTNIEKQTESIKSEISSMMGDLLNSIEESEWSESLQDKIKTFLSKKYEGEDQKIKNETLDSVSIWLAKMLSAYNLEWDLDEKTNKAIWDQIWEAMSDARYNQKIMWLAEKWRYVSGWSVWLQFINVAIPVATVSLRLRNHKLNWATDTMTSINRIKNAEMSWEWNYIDTLGDDQNLSEYLNERLNVEWISQSWDLVTIPQDVWNKLQWWIKIVIADEMKGKIKTDDSWNLIIHKDTPIRTMVAEYWDSTQRVLNIGSKESDPSWLTLTYKTPEIDESYVTKNNSELKEFPDFWAKLTQAKLDKVAKELLLQDMTFTLNEDGSISFSDWGTSYIIPAGYGLKITNTDWNCSFENVQLEDRQKFFIEYMQVDTPKKLEVAEQISTLNNGIYEEAGKITSNALRNIWKKKATSELAKLYNKWRSNLQSSNFDAAKTTMSSMLPKMDTYINQYQKQDNQVNLSQFVDKIRDLEWNDLNQTLMCLDGLFSRVENVKWNTEDWKYSLENKLWDILGWNETAILAKMEKDDKYQWKWFDKLFAAMKNNYSDLLGQEEIKTETINNAIAYNYWNPDDIDRPIFNPHIVEWSKKDLESLKLSDSNSIKEAFIDNLVDQDKALIQPIIEKINGQISEILPNGLSDAQIKALLKEKTLDINNENGKITLKADYEISAALFAQCINHMLVMENLTISLDSGSDWNTTDGSEEWNGNRRRSEISSDTIFANDWDTSSRQNTYDKQKDIWVSFKLGEEKPSTWWWDWEKTQGWDEWQDNNWIDNWQDSWDSWTWSIDVDDWTVSPDNPIDSSWNIPSDWSNSGNPLGI